MHLCQLHFLCLLHFLAQIASRIALVVHNKTVSTSDRECETFFFTEDDSPSNSELFSGFSNQMCTHSINFHLVTNWPPKCCGVKRFDTAESIWIGSWQRWWFVVGLFRFFSNRTSLSKVSNLFAPEGLLTLWVSRMTLKACLFLSGAKRC